MKVLEQSFQSKKITKIIDLVFAKKKSFAYKNIYIQNKVHLPNSADAHNISMLKNKFLQKSISEYISV